MTTNQDRQEQNEDGIEIPLERINPETLRKMIEEFVTREWSELSDSGYSMDEKVDRVLQQLHNRQAAVVFDSTTETWNIIPRR